MFANTHMKRGVQILLMSDLHTPNFYPHPGSDPSQRPNFCPHTYLRLFGSIWAIFTRIDLREVAIFTQIFTRTAAQAFQVVFGGPLTM